MAESFYSADTPESWWKELCDVVAPAITGGEFESPEDWNRALDALPDGNFTKAGVETAFWDLAAQRLNKPLHEMLAAVRTQVQSWFAVGLFVDLSDMVRTVERYLAD